MAPTAGPETRSLTFFLCKVISPRAPEPWLDRAPGRDGGWERHLKCVALSFPVTERPPAAGVQVSLCNRARGFLPSPLEAAIMSRKKKCLLQSADYYRSPSVPRPPAAQIRALPVGAFIAQGICKFRRPKRWDAPEAGRQRLGARGRASIVFEGVQQGLSIW